jgi:hypothetical protein
VAVVVQVGDDVGGRAFLVVVVVGAPGEPPRGDLLVEAVDVDLVEDQARPRRQKLRKPRAGLGEWLDVMHRDDRDRGVEARRLGLEVEQRDRLHRRPVGVRIDRDDVVARARQRSGQVAATGADLQDPRRLRR